MYTEDGSLITISKGEYMPNYIEYQQSISNELFSLKNRVRNFIDDRHWGEDGRYKEIILSEMLKRHLPKNVSIGTGFVVNQYNISTQVDIIVYDNKFPLMFEQGDFVIVPSESVLGIVEVKSSLNVTKAKTAVDKATNNGRIIGKHIFNGIFVFDNSIAFENFNSELQNIIRESDGYLNHICFGKDYFLKFWIDGSQPNNLERHYSIYELNDLAFGYFISNLVEDVYIQMTELSLPNTLKKMFYPIEETKEAHKLFEF